MLTPIKKSLPVAKTLGQALDFFTICLGGWLSYQFRFAENSQWASLTREELLVSLVTALFATLLLGRTWSVSEISGIFWRVTLGWLTAWVSLLVMLALTQTADMYSRTWLVNWFFIALVMLYSARLVAFLVMIRIRRTGYYQKRVLLVGDSSLMLAIRNRVNNALWSGYVILGELALTDVKTLAELDATLRPDEIWIGLRMVDHRQLERVMKTLNQSVANIRLLPDLMMYQILNHGMSVTLGMPMVDVSVSPMFGGRLVAKAVLDYTVASLALLMLSPLMLAIAVAVKLTSKGPIFYKQKRNGWNGESILVYKFRSMVVHQEPAGRLTQATAEDSRVTKVGRFLRKSSLDELPQFINVLQGRMSIVGPRPHALTHNEHYLKLIPHYALRHKVKPGITGWAQICGFRGRTETLDKMEERIKHDIYYLEHWSIWLDIKIILLTPLALLKGENAY
ncbi:MAG: putative colanic acid biosysnthesis UDP-glucose lipid carrier transferase [Comamonadaceae bacterium]|nr:MAG: putative colanic acid biosysnthesis UDP-glucose lipid carrier transferase [Comamonadaceae bacterium]